MKKTCSSILLVEGKDDQHVIWSLLEYYQIPEVFEVIDCDGIDNLFYELSLRLTTPMSYNHIGVVIDADINLKSRYDSYKAILFKTGKYDLSKIELSKFGTIIYSMDTNYPTLGLWIMPDNQCDGMLEDFVMTLAYENDVLMEEAEKVLSSLEIKKLNRYAPNHRSKAKIHTYLAWQEEPGKPMGQAITAKILDANSESAQFFIDWIKRLYL